MVVIRVCDLCGEEAALYCASDAAFLCCKCDARVHEVNILAARHVRQPICERCKKMMTGNGVWLSLCNSCSAETDDDAQSSLSSPTSSLSSSSSSCISSTNCSSEKLRKRSKVVVPKPMRKVGGTRSVGAVLVRWCKEIGVADVDSVVAVASRIFQLASRTFDAAGADVSELRVWMAASLWLSLRLRRRASFEKMRQLVEVSSVPEKMIMVGQARIVGMMKDRKMSRGGGDVVMAVEGWAESC